MVYVKNRKPPKAQVHNYVMPSTE